MAPSSILVTGGHGRLGKALGRLGCTALGRAELDIASSESIDAAITRLAPRAVINCAAYTAVDQAESEPEKAYAINRDGAANIAQACAHLRIPLVHISTDCVFGDGDINRPTMENDLPNPLSIYGKTKLAGEQAVRLAGRQRVCIARVCWLFDDGPDTFIDKILGAAKGRDQLQIVEDAYGRPTSTAALATQLKALAERMADGMPTPEILHFGARDAVNRYEWAKIIFAKSIALGGPAPTLAPCPAETFPEPARRPRNLVLDIATASALFGNMPDWREETGKIVMNLLAQKTQPEEG